MPILGSMIRPGKWLSVAALAVALPVFDLDCLAMSTPQQPMQCCNIMQCHSCGYRSHYSQDCCKTMSRMQVDLGQPSSAQKICISRLPIGLAVNLIDFGIIEFSASALAEHYHDPPQSSSAIVTSLRI
jgi:hypothetical protein